MYYDLLAQLKNATRARKEQITVPFSKMDYAVLKVLADAGYVRTPEKEVVGKKNFITVRLIYKNKIGAIDDFKLVSKPSRHFYADYRSLRNVKQGYGVAVLSTSRGIMTNRQARKGKVGGEYLFEIW